MLQSGFPEMPFNAYQRSFPPPRYAVPLISSGEEVTPSVSQAGFVTWPRKVRHFWAPVASSSPYSYPSHEPM